MRILVEEFAYNPTEDILEVVSELVPSFSFKGGVSVGYVGYYYNTSINDCVFILPKVLLDESGKVFGKHDPNKIVHLEDESNPLEEDERRFIYELSVWVYRAISVFKDRKKNSKIVRYERISEIGHGQKRQSNTFLDILLSLIQFNRENQDFFFFTIKNLHSGLNKINWTKTISNSRAFVQDGTPVYLKPVNKKRQINFDEELMVIYFSILNYINKEYGFPFESECHYELINEYLFKGYLSGMGKARLQEIKYKYFSDKALELWELCYAFFDEARQISMNTRQKEHLLVSDFQIVFEDIIDELLGGKQDALPIDLIEQPDGKRVDHMYRYKALTEGSSENIYYIGDSKYYKRDTSIGKEALYKQFTYARNVIQWNLDLFLDDSRIAEQEKERRCGTDKLRDEETEGYNIIPNFFISAQQRDLGKSSAITWIDRNDNRFTSRQFKNRLFDRDTLLVCHYDVNFLYVVSLYGRNNEGTKAVWREAVRKQFRTEIQRMLDENFQFHTMTPKEHVNWQEAIQQNFKDVIGKIFQPYPESETGQKYFSLALRKPFSIKDSKERKEIIDENARVKGILEPFFDIVECNVSEDKRDDLPKYTPDGINYAQDEDLLLFVVKEGENFTKAINSLNVSHKIGIALQMEGVGLQLVEGFTKAKYLVLHNKRDYKVYAFDGQGPKLIPGSEIGDIPTTKKDKDWYLVYEVNPNFTFYIGDLDLSIITKGGTGYIPQMLPLSKVLKINSESTFASN